MHTFDSAPTAFPNTWFTSRTHAHYAAQLVAAAGHTVLGPDDDFLHSSLTYDEPSQTLLGHPLTGERRLRLVLPRFTLELHHPKGTEAFALQGRSMADATAWLGDKLGVTLAFPDWDMPEGPSEAFGALTPDPTDLASLAAWFDASQRTLSRFVPTAGSASTPRLWPHHFDLAVLVTLKEDPEDAHTSVSVGLGMTPGDASSDVPYLYATPWPYPDTWTEPPLSAGRWNVEGWYGAVLAGATAKDQATVDLFLREAFHHLRKVNGC